MALNTDINLRNKCIYSLYIRNHNNEGTFKSVIKDIDNIKNLGTDIIWLMPIYPIGIVNRKGDLGSPYSIIDHRGINPEYGTLDDFKELLNTIHQKGMKVIIDIVFNHTSYESVLYKNHKEWFYKNEEGNVSCKVPGWTDIIDLDYDNHELWTYQIDTLKYWASLGVDGFRCDVAPLVPLEFWKAARHEMDKYKPGLIFLAESLDPYFIKELRAKNIPALSDSELFQAFDITYDYDTYKYFLEYLKGSRSLENYIEKKRAQDTMYPVNYVKLNFLENHDTLRAASLITSNYSLLNFTAFTFFEKGTSLIYDLQEMKCTKNPNLFEKDTITADYNQDRNKEYYNFLKNLAELKKETIFSKGNYEIIESKKNGVIEARYTLNNKSIIGIFNVENKVGEYPIGIEDNTYTNVIDNKTIEVKNGNIELQNMPVIFYK